MTATTANTYKPPDVKPIAIHYVDKHLAIVEKPAGLLSVPGRGPEKVDCLMTRVQIPLPDALTVHRLDMETSGLMIVAMTKDAQRRLSKCFEERKITKSYEAVVHREIDEASGTIDLPLRADWPRRPRQMVDRQQGKSAITHWKRVSVSSGKSRLHLRPITGRSHQLRVHLNTIGHPILGDTLYGCDSSRTASLRLMLHASKLFFHHPFTAKPIRVVSASPF